MIFPQSVLLPRRPRPALTDHFVYFLRVRQFIQLPQALGGDCHVGSVPARETVGQCVLNHPSGVECVVLDLLLIGRCLKGMLKRYLRPQAALAAVSMAGCLALACSPAAAPPLIDEDGDVLGYRPDNPAPAAAAGQDQTVEEGAEVLLDGSASSDPDGDSLTFLWVQSEGPAVELLDASTASARFVAPQVNVDTQLAFTLSVDDGETSATDKVRVTVINTVVPASADPQLAINASATEGPRR